MINNSGKCAMGIWFATIWTLTKHTPLLFFFP